MTCDTIRQRLLASESPDKPAHAEANHLAGCCACRAWLRRLAHLEEMLPLLPVPSSAPPPELLALFRATAPRPLVAAPQRLPSFRPKREGARQKLALALALAATLTLFAIAWWALPHSQTPPQKSYSQRIAEKQEAKTPRERLIGMADLAKELLDEAKADPDNAAHVAKQARWFRRLMEQDLADQAKNISVGERVAVVGGVANRLAKARDEASRLASTWKARHPDAARSLREMADAAAQAESRLRALLRT
jgi:hypothetical protein